MKHEWAFVEILHATEYNIINFVIQMLDRVQKNPDNNDEFLADILNAKKALKKLLPYF